MLLIYLFGLPLQKRSLANHMSFSLGTRAAEVIPKHPKVEHWWFAVCMPRLLILSRIIFLSFSLQITKHNLGYSEQCFLPGRAACVEDGGWGKFCVVVVPQMDCLCNKASSTPLGPAYTVYAEISPPGVSMMGKTSAVDGRSPKYDCEARLWATIVL